MKRVKRILVAFALTISMASMANDTKVISGNDGEITITENNELVKVSVLNTTASSYRLVIYSQDGEVMYRGTLGNDQSLGRWFDFKNAPEGTYKFKLVSKDGEIFSYKVKTGTRS